MNFTEQQKSQMLIIGFLGLALIAVLAWYHLMFARPKIEELNQQTSTLERQVAQKEAELKEIQTLLAQRERLEERRRMIARVMRRLPSTPDAPGFLISLVEVLRQTGIIQRLVKPEATRNRVDYTEIPYSVSAFGRYHELGQFLTLVEQNPDRFMRVRQMTVTNTIARPSIHPIEIEITTFMFNRK
jgi:Tfp pilus assembly protein PilO